MCEGGLSGAQSCLGGVLQACVCTCGNGVLDQGEMCDGANTNGETCASATMMANMTGSVSCTPNCTLNASGCTASQTPPPVGGGGMTGGGGTSGGGGTTGGGGFGGP
jgi:hypothetical protein